MGLDMYLTKRTHIRDRDQKEPEESYEITVTKNGLPTHIKPERISEIVEEIGYWRKANAIHNWFVKNVQYGIDERQLTYVPREKLAVLLKLVNITLTNRRKAKDVLPTKVGYFFGSTSYDKYYIEEIELTKEILEKALEDEDGDIYYQASW